MWKRERETRIKEASIPKINKELKDQLLRRQKMQIKLTEIDQETKMLYYLS